MIEVHKIERYPAWVDALVELIRKATEPNSFIGRLGFWVWAPGALGNPSPEGWMIIVFPTPSELVGGPHDGAQVIDGFSIELRHILECFKKVKSVRWHTPVVYSRNFDGPHVEIVADFLMEPVVLKIFNMPPPEEEAEFCLGADAVAVPKI